MTELPDGILVENWTGNVVVFKDDIIGFQAVIEPEKAGPAHVQFIPEYHDGSKYLFKVQMGPITCLPESRKHEGEQVYLIVSAALKAALPDRKDIVLPYRTIRDDRGVAIACRAFTL